MTTYRDTFAEDLAQEEEFREYLKNRGLLNVIGIKDASEASSVSSVINRMLKHNIDTKKKKLIESVKDNEKNEWIGGYRHHK